MQTQNQVLFDVFPILFFLANRTRDTTNQSEAT